MPASYKAISLTALALVLATCLSGTSASMACGPDGKCSIDILGTSANPDAWGYIEPGSCPKKFTKITPDPADATHITRTFPMTTHECTVENWPKSTILYCGKKDEDPIMRTFVEMKSTKPVCPPECTAECEALGDDWTNAIHVYKFEWQVNGATPNSTPSSTPSPTPIPTPSPTAVEPPKRHLKGRSRLAKH